MIAITYINEVEITCPVCKQRRSAVPSEDQHLPDKYRIILDTHSIPDGPMECLGSGASIYLEMAIDIKLVPDRIIKGIPEGYHIVNCGIVVKGDKYIDTDTSSTWVEIPDAYLGKDVKNYITVIRENNNHFMFTESIVKHDSTFDFQGILKEVGLLVGWYIIEPCSDFSYPEVMYRIAGIVKQGASITVRLEEKYSDQFRILTVSLDEIMHYQCWSQSWSPNC